MDEPRLHVNHEYLDWAGRAGPGVSMLDFGCGACGVVIAGRERGIDVFGVDTFDTRAERRTRSRPPASSATR